MHSKNYGRLRKMRELNLLQDQALIVAETDQNANLEHEIPGFDFVKQQDYGITVLTIYRFQKGTE